MESFMITTEHCLNKMVTINELATIAITLSGKNLVYK